MDVQITWEGNDITESVIEYRRDQRICDGIGSIDITVEADTSRAFDTWDNIILEEEGITKGKYFIGSVEKIAPDGTYLIAAQDNSKRLQDYFIKDTYLIDYFSTARFWIEKFLDEVGLSYTFTTTESGGILSNNTQLGIASAYDTIIQLLQISGWYIYFDANGTAIIGAKEVDTKIAETIQTEEIINLTINQHDRDLRNRVVVWGNANPNTGAQIFADVSVITPWNYSIKDKRTVVIANHNIDSYSAAYSIANLALNEFSKITHIKTVEIVGAIDVSIGDYVMIDSDYFKGAGLVTSIGSSASSKGLSTILILDEKCPRLFGFFMFKGNVYVGTDASGIWEKDIDFPDWANFSDGLIKVNILDLDINYGMYATVAAGESGPGGVYHRRYLGGTAWIPFASVSGLGLDLITSSGIIFPSGVLPDETPYSGGAYPFEGLSARCCIIDDSTQNVYVAYNHIELADPLYQDKVNVDRRSWVFQFNSAGGLTTIHPVVTSGAFAYTSVDIETWGSSIILSTTRGAFEIVLPVPSGDDGSFGDNFTGKWGTTHSPDHTINNYFHNLEDFDTNIGDGTTLTMLPPADILIPASGFGGYAGGLKTTDQVLSDNFARSILVKNTEDNRGIIYQFIKDSFVYKVRKYEFEFDVGFGDYKWNIKWTKDTNLAADGHHVLAYYLIDESTLATLSAPHSLNADAIHWDYSLKWRKTNIDAVSTISNVTIDTYQTHFQDDFSFAFAGRYAYLVHPREEVGSDAIHGYDLIINMVDGTFTHRRMEADFPTLNYTPVATEDYIIHMGIYMVSLLEGEGWEWRLYYRVISRETGAVLAETTGGPYSYPLIWKKEVPEDWEVVDFDYEGNQGVVSPPDSMEKYVMSYANAIRMHGARQQVRGWLHVQYRYKPIPMPTWTDEIDYVSLYWTLTLYTDPEIGFGGVHVGVPYGGVDHRYHPDPNDSAWELDKAMPDFMRTNRQDEGTVDYYGITKFLPLFRRTEEDIPLVALRMRVSKEPTDDYVHALVHPDNYQILFQLTPQSGHEFVNVNSAVDDLDDTVYFLIHDGNPRQLDGNNNWLAGYDLEGNLTKDMAGIKGPILDKLKTRFVIIGDIILVFREQSEDNQTLNVLIEYYEYDVAKFWNFVPPETKLIAKYEILRKDLTDESFRVIHRPPFRMQVENSKDTPLVVYPDGPSAFGIRATQVAESGTFYFRDAVQVVTTRDARVFDIVGSGIPSGVAPPGIHPFYIASGGLQAGRQIGFVGGPDFYVLPATLSGEVTVVQTFEKDLHNIETTNTLPSPYIFVSSRDETVLSGGASLFLGSGFRQFFQRNPGEQFFNDHSFGLPDARITIIRADDRI